MIKELINLANELDSKGFRKEADYLDAIIKNFNTMKTAMYEPVSPHDAMTEIKELAEEALTNKSFGMPMSGVADKYFVKIIRALESVNGGASLPGNLDRYKPDEDNPIVGLPLGPSEEDPEDEDDPTGMWEATGVGGDVIGLQGGIHLGRDFSKE